MVLAISLPGFRKALHNSRKSWGIMAISPDCNVTPSEGHLLRVNLGIFLCIWLTIVRADCWTRRAKSLIQQGTAQVLNMEKGFFCSRRILVCSENYAFGFHHKVFSSLGSPFLKNINVACLIYMK